MATRPVLPSRCVLRPATDKFPPLSAAHTCIEGRSFKLTHYGPSLVSASAYSEAGTSAVSARSRHPTTRPPGPGEQAAGAPGNRPGRGLAMPRPPPIGPSHCRLGGRRRRPYRGSADPGLADSRGTVADGKAPRLKLLISWAGGQDGRDGQRIPPIFLLRSPAIPISGPRTPS